MTASNCTPKVKYTNRFAPLVAKRLNSDPDNFKTWLDNTFEPESVTLILNNFGLNSEVVTPKVVETINVEGSDPQTGLSISNDIGSDTTSILFSDVSNAMVIKNVINDSKIFEKLKNNFIKAIVGFSIYNSEQGLVDRTATLLGYSALNMSILKYKLRLLKQIVDKIEISAEDNLDWEYIYKGLANNVTETVANDLFDTILNKYEIQILDQSDKSQDIYEAYLILKNFDGLVEEWTPFIGVTDPTLVNNNKIINKYEYTLGGIKHRSHFTTNSYTDASKYTNDALNLILDHLPEVRIDGTVLDTTIGATKFNNVMSKVIKSVELYPQFYANIKRDIKNDIYSNINEIIDIYIKNMGKMNKNDSTFYVDALRGIQKYVFNPNADKEFQIRLLNQAYNTQYAIYTIYQNNPESKRFTYSSLFDKIGTSQTWILKESIDGKIITSKSNPERFISYLNTWGFTIDNNKILYNGEVVTKTTKKGKTVYNLSNLSDIDTILSLFNEITGLEITREDFDKTYSIGGLNAELNNNIDNIKNIILFIIDTSINNKYAPNVIINKNGVIQDIAAVANILSIINGSDVANVITDFEGNLLPLYHITSLAYNGLQIAQLYKDKHNFLSYNYNIIGQPRLRNGVNLNEANKVSKHLTSVELSHIQIFNEFNDGLNNEDLILLQPSCFADKSKHFLIPFDLKNVQLNSELLNTIPKEYKTRSGRTESINLTKYINDFKNGKLTPESKTLFYEIIYDLRTQQYSYITNTILNNYNLVFEDSFTSLSDVDTFLKNTSLTLSEIRNKFNENGVKFIEEVHVTSGITNGVKHLQFNEVLLNYSNIYNNTADGFNLHLNRFSTQYNNFINTLEVDEFKPNRFFNTDVDDWAKTTENGDLWFNAKGDMLFERSYKIEVDGESKTIFEKNPLLEAYYLSDVWLSTEYSNFMVGGSFSHPNKSGVDTTDSDYVNKSEASRWNMQNKRNVIYGASTHKFAQNLEGGVPSKIKAVTIDDMSSSVFNPTGDVENGLTSMDGSGLSSPFWARQVQRSLLNASVNGDMKTIYHHLHPELGTSTLIKWAEFIITNERRRKSIMSKVSAERLFKKMHNLEFTSEQSNNMYSSLLNLINSLKGEFIYFKNYYTNEIFKIQLSTDGSLVNISTWQVDSKGNNISIGELTSKSQSDFNSIYDYDQLFGGAFNLEFSEKSNKFINGNNNIDYVYQLMSETGVNDSHISVLINKSAMKNGIVNLNSSDKFYNDEQFTTWNLDTNQGGVQLDAEHELDDSEISEVTQLIRALVQGGHTNDITEVIYSNLGNIINQSNSDVAEVLDSPQELHDILSRAFIKSFMLQNEGSTSMSTTFVEHALKGLKTKTNKLPISSSLLSLFNSVISSNAVKTALRRKFAGVASTLTPAYNMMQVFTINGVTYNSEQLIDIVARRGITHQQTDSGIKHAVELAMTEYIINDELNPFIVPISQNEIDFEDTIVFQDEYGIYGHIEIDTYEKYFEIKHSSAYKNVQLYNWTIKPKNLKAANVLFTVDQDGMKQYSIYDLDVTILQHMLKNSDKWASEENILLRNTLLNNLNLLKTFEKEGVESILPKLEQILQDTLESISDKNIIPNQYVFGNKVYEGTYKTFNVTYKPAQIVMGKIFAKQFLLEDGENINNVTGPEFFFNKLKNLYKINTKLTPVEHYDVILFDDSGNQILVKHIETSNMSNIDRKYEYIDNNVYINGKLFFTPTVEKFITVNGESVIVTTDLEQTVSQLISQTKFKTRRYARDTNNVFETRLKNRSDLMYETFLDSLHAVGARVPTQSMQSFMAMEIVMFTDSLVNDVYVPQIQLWLQGSDFDIDKLYIMMKGVQSNGTTYSDSNLLGLYTQNEISQLPKPDGIKRNIDNNSDGFVITKYVINNKQNGKYSISDLKDALLSNNITYAADVNERDAIHFIKTVNSHAMSVRNPKYASELLKNKIMDGIFDVTQSPKNFINSYVPINMDDARRRSNNAQTLHDMSIMHSDNPASKGLAQQENAVGVNVIGIFAVGLKSFFTLTNFYNSQFKEAAILLEDAILSKDDRKMQDAKFILKSLIMNDSEIGLTTLANANLKRVVKIINEANLSGKYGDPTFAEFLKAAKNSVVPDASLQLSGLLSAATDNAKELILAKLNATSKYAGIYATLLMKSWTFDRIVDFMTDDFMSTLDRLTNVDIFRPYTAGRNLNNAIDFTLGLKILKGVESNTFDSLLKTAIEQILEIEDLRKYVNSEDISYKWFYETFIIGDGIIIENVKLTYAMISDQFTKIVSELTPYIPSKSQNFNEEYNIESEAAELEAQAQAAIAAAESGQNVTVKEFKNLNYLNELEVYALYMISNEIDVLKSNIDSGLDLQKVALLKSEIVPSSEEIKLFGKLLSLNQGVKTNIIDSYLFKSSIEDSVNSTLNAVSKHPDIPDPLKEWYKADSNSFDFVRFVDPNEIDYRDMYIDLYEYCKASFNILSIFASSPDFFEMGKVFGTNYKALSKVSIKNRTFTTIMQNLKNNKLTYGATHANYKNVFNLTDDLLIHKYLSEQNIKFILPVGTTMYNRMGSLQKLKKKPTTFNLMGTTGPVNFKIYIEQNILPFLQEQYPDNKFIKNIKYGVKTIGGYNKIFLKLDVNTMNIDKSLSVKTKFNEIQSDFNKIANIIVNDGVNQLSVLDIFHLYNLIVFKNGFSSGSFMELFTPYYGKRNSITNYYDWLYDKDVSNEVYTAFDIYNVAAHADILKNNYRVTSSNQNEHITLKVYPEGMADITLGGSWQNINTSIVPTSEIAENFVKDIKSIYEDAEIIIYTNEDVVPNSIYENVPEGTKAFINNGIIYFNKDSVDRTTAAHELSHLILAQLKAVDPEQYYKLMDLYFTSAHPDIVNTIEYLSDHEYYKTLIMSDFKEEVLVHVIEKQLSVNNINDKSILEIYNTLVSRLVNPDTSTKFSLDQKSIKLVTKIKSIKNKMVKDDQLKCK